ncbi:MAG: NAD(+) synthase [Christensenellales bacterium]
MNSGLIRVAAAVPAVTVGNLRKNKENISAMIIKAQQNGVSIAAFPELSITSYTLGDLFRQASLLEQSEKMLQELLEETKHTKVMAVIGMPVYSSNKLYNAAIAIQSGRILGVIPKAFIPNYSEYCEQRWFASGINIVNQTINICGQDAPFGIDILFECPRIRGLLIGIELCEDLWVPFPPHAYQAMAGAAVFINISASAESAGKSEYREELVKQQSGRFIGGFLYVSAGPGESTTDTVFGGHAIIAENGKTLLSSPRFRFDSHINITEFDLHRLTHDRILKNTFIADNSGGQYRKVQFEAAQVSPKFRTFEKTPFVPEDIQKRNLRCREVFDIQVTALTKRLLHIGSKNLIVGVSGGLDSALALMVSREAAKRAGLLESAVTGVVMPGLGSTDITQYIARRLVKAAGATLVEINIAPATKAHLEDLGHGGEADITFENAQARERTQVLMGLANKNNGIVVGTGDLSELALGFCTYAGDQISMYGVNAGVAKTLIRQMVLYLSRNDNTLNQIMKEIVAIPPSPELLPPDDKGMRQDTQEQIGPYELNDFFMYYMLRFEMTPRKILLLANHAFSEFDESFIKERLRKFYRRFFSSQFKRSCMPDGPKVGSVSLSPRTGWRMPSDADVQMWLSELE